MTPIGDSRRQARPAQNRAIGAAMAVVALACAWFAYTLGDGYVARLSDHRGFRLVAVDDTVDANAPIVRPRHTVLIVADGLRADRALGLATVATLAAAGQCRITHTSDVSISRPVYAVISTGLESDRTGSRNNANHTPLAAESIWQVARAAGLTVTAYSHLSWWRELFPAGFTDYVERPAAEDLFATATLTDLTLIHPVYADNIAHDHGAASPEYTAAVARLDEELARFLTRVDLERDVIVLTADHGHTDRGGHGGAQPVVNEVLTCIAGSGIRRAGVHAGRLEATALAPMLAVRLGVRFPRHMRAGDDDLDAIWEIVEVTTDAPLSAAYARDRAAAIARFRAENAAAVARWLGRDGASWNALYDAGRRRHRWQGAAALAAVLLALLAVAWRRGLGWGGAIGMLAWMTATAAVSAAVYAAWRGGLDFTSINKRALFVRTAGLTCTAVGIGAALLHWLAWRDLRRLIADQMGLLIAALSLCLVHPLIYGWTLGFPLPSPEMMFVPFFGAMFALVHGCLAAALIAIGQLRPR